MPCASFAGVLVCGIDPLTKIRNAAMATDKVSPETTRTDEITDEKLDRVSGGVQIQMDASLSANANLTSTQVLNKRR